MSDKRKTPPHRLLVSHGDLEPIASTKFKPPRAARRPVPREGLIKRLMEGRRKRCTVLLGPAGSGKTNVLVAWRKALMAIDFDVVWLSVQPEDNQPARFFECLLAALSEVDPHAVAEAETLLTHDAGQTATEQWVLALAQGLGGRERELVLVIDDLHWVDAQLIMSALQWLLDYAPPCLHLVLSSRSAPPLALGRLRTQRELAEYDLRDLRFTVEESEQFLREQLGEISARDARKLHELTDGWIAGLQLFALDLKNKQGERFAPVEMRDARSFASYFEREILEHLAPDDLELLTRLSICSRFCASLAAALLGQPRAVARAMRSLDQIDSGNLFLTQVQASDEETWYRLHPLLREALLTRLERRPAEEVRQLHVIAWRWFDERGHVDEAVRHAVRAGEAGAAAAAVEASGQHLLERGEFARISGLIQRLPPEEVERRFGLRLLSVYVQLYSRQVSQARAAADRMGTESDRFEPRERWMVTTLRGSVAAYQDDLASVGALEAELRALPDTAPDYVLATRRNVLAWLLIRRCEYASARELLRAGGLQRSAERTDVVGRCMLGMSYLHEGEVHRAEKILRDTLHDADGRGAAASGGAFTAAGLLAEVLYEINEVEAAGRLLEPRLPVLEHAATPDTVLRALMLTAIWHRRSDRRLEGWEQLERLEDYAVGHDLNRILAHALQIRVRWHLQEKDGAAAAAALQRLEALSVANPSAVHGPEIELSLRQTRAMVGLRSRDAPRALADLEAALALCQSVGRLRSVPNLHLLIATALLRLDRREQAWEHALEGLRLGHRQGLVRSMLDVPGASSLLAEFQAERGDRLDPVLSFYVRRLQVAASTPTVQLEAAPAAMPRPMAEKLSGREAEVAELLEQALPNKKIARALGVTPETVKWHLRRIYTKLGVGGRDAAVARLRDRRLASDSKETPTRSS